MIEDIVKADLCTGCGVCVSESPDTLKMHWNKNGFITPISLLNTDNGAARVCPFNPNPDVAVEDEDKLSTIFLNGATKKDNRIGSFIETYVGYSKEYRETSSSGGIATYIFEELLKRRIVDHLFIVKEVNGTYEYQLFSDFKLINQQSKTRYIPVTLEKLFTEIENIEGKIAVSGVACFIKAIRLKQYYHPWLKEKIPFLIGIICGGLKSKFFTDYLAQKSGIKGEYKKQEYRIKNAQSSASDYEFGAYDTKNEFHQIKMKSVGDMWGSGLFKANACDFCDDVTTELADISLGDAWLHPYSIDGLGNSVIVTRSLLANELIKEGIENNLLFVSELNLDIFKSSQNGSFKHRQLGLKHRITRKKSIVPFKRKKFLENIPLEFRIVQTQRMIVRAQSLRIWTKTSDSCSFEKEIAPFKQRLNKKTKVYHRIQSIKRKLGFKTL